jgi:hypothetical protein
MRDCPQPCLCGATDCRWCHPLTCDERDEEDEDDEPDNWRAEYREYLKNNPVD